MALLTPKGLMISSLNPMQSLKINKLIKKKIKKSRFRIIFGISN